jgi:hypothetical protein
VADETHGARQVADHSVNVVARYRTKSGFVERPDSRKHPTAKGVGWLLPPLHAGSVERAKVLRVAAPERWGVRVCERLT